MMVSPACSQVKVSSFAALLCGTAGGLGVIFWPVVSNLLSGWCFSLAATGPHCGTLTRDLLAWLYLPCCYVG
jgi:hypothetical protein